METIGNEMLDELSLKFGIWREGKTHRRQRIPQELWDEAVAVCEYVKPGKVAKLLGLDQNKLNKRLGRTSSREMNESQGFIMFGSQSSPGLDLPVRVSFRSTDGRSVELASGSDLAGRLLKLGLEWLG